MNNNNYNFDALKKTSWTEKSKFGLIMYSNSKAILAGIMISLLIPILFIASYNRTLQAVGMAIGLVWLVLGVGTLLFATYLLVTQYNRKKRAIEQFVADNGFVPCEPDYKAVPDSIKPHFIVREQAENAFDIPVGNKKVAVYEYIVETHPPGSRENYKSIYRIASFKLSKSYPHIFLDGKVNGVNHHFNKDQRVSLEGDFDKYFTLYSPDTPADHTGALAVISPDVMSTLIDSAAAFDIEIEGRYVSLITKSPIYTYDRLPRVLYATGLLIKELEHLDISWQPINSVAVLKGWRPSAVTIGLIVLLLAAAYWLVYLH